MSKIINNCLCYTQIYNSGYIEGGGYNYDWASKNATTGAAGGSKAHNNMPPYKSVYIWERTE